MQATRDDSFVPLTAATAPAREGPNLQATVMSQPGSTQPFHVLGHGGSGVSPGEPANQEATVTLRREGDRITGIRVQCTCGQVIELDCTYDPLPASAAAPPSPPVPAGEPAPRSRPAPPRHGGKRR
jgi:hypothetical protein